MDVAVMSCAKHHPPLLNEMDTPKIQRDEAHQEHYFTNRTIHDD
jgi:hypothetical protein